MTIHKKDSKINRKKEQKRLFFFFGKNHFWKKCSIIFSLEESWIKTSVGNDVQLNYENEPGVHVWEGVQCLSKGGWLPEDRKQVQVGKQILKRSVR